MLDECLEINLSSVVDCTSNRKIAIDAFLYGELKNGCIILLYSGKYLEKHKISVDKLG